MTGADVTPQQTWLASSCDPAARIHVSACGVPGGTPLVMVHGFFQPASAILDVPGWSLQQSLAQEGMRVVLFDLRGYGRSTRPPFMDRPAELSQPSLGCLDDAVADISDVVEHVCRVEGRDQVDLLGYSWGTARCCAYSIRTPQRVRRLALYAPVWRPRTGAAAEAVDPRRAGHLNPALGGYRSFGPGDLARQWDAEIGAREWRLFRDARALKATEQALLESDEALQGRGYRSPLGPMCDALAAASGRPLFDASQLRCDTLLARGAQDTLSTAADSQSLFDALGTPHRQLITIDKGTHCLHLEHARDQLIDAIAEFLGASHGPAQPAQFQQ